MAPKLGEKKKNKNDVFLVVEGMTGVFPQTLKGFGGGKKKREKKNTGGCRPIGCSAGKFRWTRGGKRQRARLAAVSAFGLVRSHQEEKDEKGGKKKNSGSIEATTEFHA